jgi:hypothetical protein
VHAPSNFIVTSLAVAIPPELLATFDSEGAYLPRVTKHAHVRTAGQTFVAMISS